MRRRRRGTRGSRRPTQWCTGAGFSAPGYGVINASQAVILVGSATLGTASNPPVLARFTIERVVGQIVVWFSAGAVQGDVKGLSLGIGLVDILLAGIPNNPVIWDPQDAIDGDKSWLWQYHSTYGTEVPSVIEQQNVTIPVDIRVKRKVLGDKALCLFHRAFTTTPATGTLNISPFLRTLISRVA